MVTGSNPGRLKDTRVEEKGRIARGTKSIFDRYCSVEAASATAGTTAAIAMGSNCHGDRGTVGFAAARLCVDERGFVTWIRLVQLERDGARRHCRGEPADPHYFCSARLRALRGLASWPPRSNVSTRFDTRGAQHAITTRCIAWSNRLPFDPSVPTEQPSWTAARPITMVHAVGGRIDRAAY